MVTREGMQTQCLFKLGLKHPFLIHIWIMFWTKTIAVRYRIKTTNSPTISLLWHCGAHSQCFLYVRGKKWKVVFNIEIWTWVYDAFLDSHAAQILFPVRMRFVSFWGCFGPWDWLLLKRFKTTWAQTTTHSNTQTHRTCLDKFLVCKYFPSEGCYWVSELTLALSLHLYMGWWREWEGGEEQ